MDGQRIVRVVLPVEQIRRMDQLILSGTGGFDTRNEFIREAIEAQIAELTYEPAPVEHAVPPPAQLATGDGLMPAHVAASAGTAPEAAAIVRCPKRGAMIDVGVDAPAAGPLFGLHNRDFPSIWALCSLAHMAQEGPVEVSLFYDEVTKAAWEVGRSLRALEVETGSKLTALFPTNEKKPQSAEEGFRSFAIGGVADAQSTPRTSGPLFQWSAVRLDRRDESLVIAPTKAGYELLTALDGLTAFEPHDTALARIFLDYLERHAPDDWRLLFEVVEACEASPSRADLISLLLNQHSDWSETTASTMSSAYIARAREWGLLAPKQLSGKYVLTDFGVARLEEAGRAT